MKCLRIVVFFLFLNQIHAQIERYELGRRLRLFETRLEEVKDVSLRKRALEEINRAVLDFFSFKFREAARKIDKARLILESRDTKKEAVWAESLFINPDSRIYDSTGKVVVKVKLDSFYAVEDLSKKVLWKLSLVDSDGNPVSSTEKAQVSALPLDGQIALSKIKQGDYFLVSEILVDGKVKAISKVLISFIGNLDERLELLKEKIKKEEKGWRRETAWEYVKTLEELVQGKIKETDIPACDFLLRAESYRGSFPKEGLLVIPYLDSQLQVSRIFVPDSKKTLPVVIALHGAGGSENLFFEGYGGGKILELCKRRGWILVAPRNFGFSAKRMEEFLNALSDIYPIDRRRIFLIGHSLGSAQALTIVSEKPELFRSLALISAGRLQKFNEKMTKMPIFIGTGTADFSLESSKALYESLLKSGAEKLKIRIYQDVEHLTAVQFSLEEVFEFFDSAI